MKKTEFQTKWYYRLWQVLSVILLLISAFLSISAYSWEFSFVINSQDFLWQQTLEIMVILLKMIGYPAIVLIIFYAIFRGIIYIIFGKIHNDHEKPSLFRHKFIQKAGKPLLVVSTSLIFLLTLSDSYKYFDAHPKTLYVKATNLRDFVDRYDNVKNPNAFEAFIHLDGRFSCLGEDGVYTPISYSLAQGFCNKNLDQHLNEIVAYLEENWDEKILTKSEREKLPSLVKKTISEVDQETGEQRVCIVSSEMECDSSGNMYVYENSWKIYFWSLISAIAAAGLYLFSVSFLRKLYLTVSKKRGWN